MTDVNMEDPFGTGIDEDDPFADADSFKGNAGPFVPWPNISDVTGRLVVLVPRTHEKEAEVSQYLQEKYGLNKNREEWKVDLVVLDGEVPWTYEYQGKKEKDSKEYETMSHTVESLPYLIPGWKVVWGNIIGAINKLQGGTKPFAFGRIMAGYSAKEMRSGKTYADFAAEVSAWEDRVRKDPKKAGPAPKPVWHFEPSTDPAERALALEWWKAAKANGFEI